jgi:hypothetical protein
MKIDSNHKMQINPARVRETGEMIWFVSFASSPVRDGEQQMGYYQQFHRKPNDHDIEVVYKNFLELLKRTPVK